MVDLASGHPLELTAFMTAIRAMESGGRVLGAANYRAIGPSTRYGRATGAYQFLDSTWNGYQGYDRAADAPAAVQDARAAQLMSQYFEEFRSWDLVAVAWHAGPGKARQVVRQGRSALSGVTDGGASTVDYSRWVQDNTGIILGRVDPDQTTDPFTGNGYSENRGVAAFYDQYEPARGEAGGQIPTGGGGGGSSSTWGTPPATTSAGGLGAAWSAVRGAAGSGAASGSTAAVGAWNGVEASNSVTRDEDDPLSSAAGGPGTVGGGGGYATTAPIVPLENGGVLDLNNADAVRNEVETKYGQMSDEEFLSEIYSTVLGREPDAQGMEFWLGQLSSGMPRDQVYRGFYGSDEGGNTEPPLLSEVENMIRAKYPDWAWAMNNDEVRDLLLEAVDPMRGMDDVTFRSRMRQTDWWQSTEASVRDWDARASMDPATAQRAVEKMATELGRRATSLGATMTQEQLMALAEKSLRFGLTETEIDDALAASFDAADPRGDVAANLEVARGQARDYLVAMDDSELLKWAQQIAVGQASADDLQERMKELARAKYGGNEHLSNLIDSGVAPATFFEEHKRMIAREMDLSTSQVDLLDPKYARVLTSAEGNSVRPMNLDETRSFLRSQPEWQSTSTGRRRIAETTQGILQAFGKVA